jgi:hypothetical protein
VLLYALGKPKTKCYPLWQNLNLIYTLFIKKEQTSSLGLLFYNSAFLSVGRVDPLPWTCTPTTTSMTRPARKGNPGSCALHPGSYSRPRRCPSSERSLPWTSSRGPEERSSTVDLSRRLLWSLGEGDSYVFHVLPRERQGISFNRRKVTILTGFATPYIDVEYGWLVQPSTDVEKSERASLPWHLKGGNSATPSMDVQKNNLAFPSKEDIHPWTSIRGTDGSWTSNNRAEHYCNCTSQYAMHPSSSCCTYKNINNVHF